MTSIKRHHTKIMLFPVFTIAVFLIPLISGDYFDELGVDYAEPIKVQPTAKVPTKAPVFHDEDKLTEPSTDAPALYCTAEKWYNYFVVIYTPTSQKPSNESKNICAGTVLSRYSVLTAAHCCDTIFKEVFVGYVKEQDEFVNVKKVKNVAVHPRYDKDTLAYDICLMEIGSPLILVGEADIIQLASNEPSLTISAGQAKNAFFLGYGTNRTTSAFQLSDKETMACMKLSLLSEDECKSRLPEKGGIEYDPSLMLCGEASEKRTSFNLELDSGGPLIVDDKQVGIASFVVGTSNGTGPSLVFYTRVDAVWDFITPTLRSGCQTKISKISSSFTSSVIFSIVIFFVLFALEC